MVPMPVMPEEGVYSMCSTSALFTDAKNPPTINGTNATIASAADQVAFTS